ncbi:MAG: aldehyde dehydrogenase family protein [Leptospiraceae bacterium]|nr:aldehyde dehydrogenase family protein [Leptospiraceae bacterium]
MSTTKTISKKKASKKKSPKVEEISKNGNLSVESEPQTQVKVSEVKTLEAPARPAYELEIDRIFQLQRENRWKIANTSAEERILKLKKLREALERRADDLRLALYKDFRKSPHEVDMTEIFPVVQEIKDACRNLKSWMRPKSVATPLTLFGSTSKIIYEPKGQVFIIGPWNYPFHLVVAPLVAAVAAGNVAVIRPSSNTPHTSEFTKSLLAEVFPESEVAVTLCDRQAADYWLTKPFDHIFFTGSPEVGVKIMEAAAKNLASVTLELGGKSPVIVDETAVMDYTITNLLWGKVLNGGQTCVGVDYALVHETRLPEFTEKIKQRIREFYGNLHENWQVSPEFCRIINDKNFQRLKGLIDSAISMGANLVEGGYFDEKERYISPTVLSGVTLDMPIMKEEIFGPILPIISYSNLDEAIRMIQSKPKPLALYMFSEDAGNIRKVLKNTSSGGAVINGVILHLINDHLPFGGVNHSGLGNYHGFFGFKAFSHERALLKLNKLDLLVLRKLMPPYTETTKKIANFIMKYL